MATFDPLLGGAVTRTPKNAIQYASESRARQLSNQRSQFELRDLKDKASERKEDLQIKADKERAKEADINLVAQLGHIVDLPVNEQKRTLDELSASDPQNPLWKNLAGNPEKANDIYMVLNSKAKALYEVDVAGTRDKQKAEIAKVKQDKYNNTILLAGEAYSKISNSDNYKANQATLASLLNNPDVQGNPELLAEIQELTKAPINRQAWLAEQFNKNPRNENAGGQSLAKDVSPSQLQYEEYVENQRLNGLPILPKNEWESSAKSGSPSGNRQDSTRYAELKATESRTNEQQFELNWLEEKLDKNDDERLSFIQREAELKDKIDKNRREIALSDPDSPESKARDDRMFGEQKDRINKLEGLIQARAGEAAVKRVMASMTNKTSGLYQAALSWFPGTDQLSHEKFIDTLKSKLALTEMAKLKDLSKTGSTGFGALSERELNVLQERIAALNPNMNRADKEESLKIILEHYQNSIRFARLSFIEPAKTREGRLKQLEKSGLSEMMIEDVIASEALVYPAMDVQSPSGSIKISDKPLNEWSDEEIEAFIAAEAAK